MPLGLRSTVAEFLGACGVSARAIALRRRLRSRRLVVLNYHRVNSPSAVTEVDKGVLDATPESLDRQLTLLKTHFTPIGLGDLLEHLDGAPLPPNPALVSFDDGYRDNHDHALPVLLRHGISATFFIATDYVDGRRLYWWDRISWIVKHAEQSRFAIEYPEHMEVNVETAGAEWRLHRIVKIWKGLDLERFLDELADAARAPWDAPTEARLVDELVMTWDHVRALRRAGMDVGSHTRSHRVLQTLTPSELSEELSGSRECMEAALGESIHAVAYPVGHPIAGHPEIEAAFRSAGYRLGFTYGQRAEPMETLVTHDVGRLAPEEGMSDARFLSMLAFPWLDP